MTTDAIITIAEKQKTFYRAGKTLDISFRIRMLKALKQEIIHREKEIAKAMYLDFRKPEFETVMTESALVVSELSLVVRNLRRWAAPKRVLTTFANFPSVNKIHKEPYGNVLLIAPWNYPFLLVFSPLIGAIAAGNTVVIKPSEHAENTGKLVAEIIEKVFDPGHVAVIEGETQTAVELLRLKWDYIFFTGSVAVGKKVAQAAAEHLTPVTLELGGKNPCIVDETANLRLAARRIIWGKFINGGQTCIAPDYVLVHKNVEDAFVGLCKANIRTLYGDNPQLSQDFCRIINRKNFDSLVELMKGQDIIAGGETDAAELYIAPTLIDNPKAASPLMQREIFGPVLPVISYSDENEIYDWINRYEKPLALYVFSNHLKFIKRITANHAFGGGTVNDTLVHFVNHRLPFGGVGFSGVGAYHGKHTFKTFSYEKGITTRFNFLDLPVRYAPYKDKLKTLKFFMRWLA